jgi:hypothetical protein
MIRAADAAAAEHLGHEHALHLASAVPQVAQRDAARRLAVKISQQQATVRAGVFAGQAGQLLVERALVEIAVDQRDVLDMPRAMPRHEGAHQGPHIVQLGRPRRFNNLGHRFTLSIAPAMTIRSRRRGRTRRSSNSMRPPCLDTWIVASVLLPSQPRLVIIAATSETEKGESMELAPAEIRERLEPQERVLWWGGPKGGIRFRLIDLFLVPFSLLWGGGAIFWETMAIRQDAPLFSSFSAFPLSPWAST